MEALAQRILELRAEFKLSSGKVAGRLGVSHGAVIKWEKNRGNPTLVNLLALCELFGVTPDYLLGFSDERERPESPANQRFYPARDGA